MTSEVKEIHEVGKESDIKNLPVPMDKPTRKHLKKLTGAYLAKYGKKTNVKKLAGIIFKKAIKTAEI